jgi:hypothetical protein
LLEFVPIARIAKTGLATVEEIERSWSFIDMEKALAYISMDNAIEKAIQKALTPKV